MPDHATRTKNSLRARLKEAARYEPRFVSVPVPLAAGGQATLYSADIPGYSTMGKHDRGRMTGILMKKIIAGHKLYGQLSEADPAELPAPRRQDVSNLLWFLKSKANEAANSPYEKGAMTIPDPGNRIRSYLDRMETEAGGPDLYPRRSTHLPEQQLGDYKKKYFFSRTQKSAAAQEYLAQHQPRGTDFYEGAPGDGGIGDTELLLPSGMQTFLYQQVTAPSGRSRLYIKMETEGAAGDRLTPKYRGGVQARPREWADYGHTAAHLANLLKKIATGGHASNPDLPQLREDVPKPIRKLFKKILSELKSKDRRVYEVMSSGSGIGHMHQNIDRLYEDAIAASPAIKELLAELDFAIKSTDYRGERDLRERFGEEVVLMRNHLEGPVPRNR